MFTLHAFVGMCVCSCGTCLNSDVLRVICTTYHAGTQVSVHPLASNVRARSFMNTCMQHARQNVMHAFLQVYTRSVLLCYLTLPCLALHSIALSTHLRYITYIHPMHERMHIHTYMYTEIMKTHLRAETSAGLLRSSRQLWRLSGVVGG